MASWNILFPKPLNLKNKITKIQHKKKFLWPVKKFWKIFPGPSIYAQSIHDSHKNPPSLPPTYLMCGPLEYIFVYQFSSIGLNTLFPEMAYVFVFEAENIYFSKSRKIPVMPVAISAVFYFGLWVSTETSYVILQKELVIFTSDESACQIIFFFFEWVLITTS